MVRGAKAFAAALEVNRTLSDLDLSETALCGKQKWMIIAAVQCKKDLSGVEAIAKALRGASWPDGALRDIRIKDNFLGPSGEELVTRAMEKPAVVAERAREARRWQMCLDAQRRICEEGRCDSSCTWCDNPGNGGC